MKTVLICFLSFIFYTITAWGAPPSIGILTPLGESYEIFLDGKKISGSTPVAKENLIRLGKNSVAELKMENGDRFVLASEAEFHVKEYFDGEGNSSEHPSLFELIRGKLEALIDRRDREKILIKTGNAVIGVKGTNFIVEVPSFSLTQVTTLSGIVSFQRIDQETNAHEISLRPGFRSLIVKASSPTPPLSISSGDRTEINRIFQRLKRPLFQQIQPSSESIVDNTLNQEIKNRVIQQALHNQAALIVDVVF
ncbi:MAG: FecR domain-containing protein [SAR324 cluster bacterium]|nr:FecR domain-containing protein [SAR324 cluster bacterium]